MMSANLCIRRLVAPVASKIRLPVRKNYSKGVSTLEHIDGIAEVDTEDQPGHDKLFQSFVDSLESKGFNRNLKSYSPPPDIRDRIHSAYLEVFDSQKQENWETTQLSDSRLKFKFLVKCSKEAGYSLHNSQLHKMKTIGDVLKFYQSTVNAKPAYDEMLRCDLPPNMHIVVDPVRFHPETDTKFGGVSAYPRRSTIVTGLTFKKKYKGYKAEKVWPHSNLPT